MPPQTSSLTKPEAQACRHTGSVQGLAARRGGEDSYEEGVAKAGGELVRSERGDTRLKRGALPSCTSSGVSPRQTHTHTHTQRERERERETLSADWSCHVTFTLSILNPATKEVLDKVCFIVAPPKTKYTKNPRTKKYTNTQQKRRTRKRDAHKNPRNINYTRCHKKTITAQRSHNKRSIW